MSDPERSAFRIFNKADQQQTGQLDKQDMAGLVLTLWESIGRPMPQGYHDKIPTVVSDALKQYDTRKAGALDFPDFLEMLSQTPWRVLLPVAEREEFVMDRLRQKEDAKAKGGTSAGKPRFPSVPPPPFPTGSPERKERSIGTLGVEVKTS